MECHSDRKYIRKGPCSLHHTGPSAGGNRKNKTYVIVVDGVWGQADVLDVSPQLRQHLHKQYYPIIKHVQARVFLRIAHLQTESLLKAQFAQN